MPASNNWHTETAVRYNSNIHGHYDMSPGSYEPRRHTSISYSSRNDALMQMAPPDMSYGHIDTPDNMIDARNLDARPNIVDLQGSREQRGSAFELYRKPVHHNMR